MRITITWSTADELDPCKKLTAPKLEGFMFSVDRLIGRYASTIAAYKPFVAVVEDWSVFEKPKLRYGEFSGSESNGTLAIEAYEGAILAIGAESPSPQRYPHIIRFEQVQADGTTEGLLGESRLVAHQAWQVQNEQAAFGYRIEDANGRVYLSSYPPEEHGASIEIECDVAKKVVRLANYSVEELTKSAYKNALKELSSKVTE